MNHHGTMRFALTFLAALLIAPLAGHAADAVINSLGMRLVRIELIAFVI